MPLASFLANSANRGGGGEEDERQSMRTRILQQYAGSLGAPSYEMEAAQFNKAQRDKASQEGGLQNLLPLVQLGMKAFGPDKKKEREDEERERAAWGRGSGIKYGGFRGGGSDAEQYALRDELSNLENWF